MQQAKKGVAFDATPLKIPNYYLKIILKTINF